MNLVDDVSREEDTRIMNVGLHTAQKVESATYSPQKPDLVADSVERSSTAK
jgi:hypothetical protein